MIMRRRVRIIVMIRLLNVFRSGFRFLRGRYWLMLGRGVGKSARTIQTNNEQPNQANNSNSKRHAMNSHQM
ncbi:MAG: hypothetical protein CMF73_04960 [Maricaulis sp.]|nr:hypothetical protein [Maricaulis sp.]